jgi:uncharacterized Zn finger protein
MSPEDLFAALEKAMATPCQHCGATSHGIFVSRKGHSLILCERCGVAQEKAAKA